MLAIVMREPGGPQVLEAVELPVPEPSGDHDLLVRLKAAGVNPVDTKLRARGTYFPGHLPAILGCDGAGIVERSGPAVTRFKAGDAVYFCNGGIGKEPGCYAEYTVVDERVACAKPDALTFEQAAAVPLGLITAWEALFDRGRLRDGSRVLIHGGAGGVGHLAIQLARLHQAQVATTVSSPAKAAFVRELGAHFAIDYTQQDFVRALHNWTGGAGVNLALDTVGGEIFARTLAAMAFYGDLVTLLQPGEVDWKTARTKNLRIGLELMLTPMSHGLLEARQHHAEILARGGALFDGGKLNVHLAQCLPLTRAADAHRLLEEGHMQGKLVLTLPP
ncbi:MAG TPA: alcohol dehydrogenase [Gammaproteobacteria bacterium]|nr:alcohol dehydrogenase [Gammaproteobacteria bacterium]